MPRGHALSSCDSHGGPRCCVPQHAPEAVPRVVYVHEEKGLLILEYLEGYLPLSDFLQLGDTGDPGIPALIGRMLGRLHSSSLATPKARFGNEMHIQFWNKCVFAPLLEGLREPQEHCTKPFLAPLVASLNAEGVLTRAISAVHDHYQFKKQCLVHAGEWTIDLGWWWYRRPSGVH
jgi:5-methylthioribose kinase